MSVMIEIGCTGYSILGGWYEGSSDEVVLFSMGITSDRSRQVDLATAILHNTGRSVLVIDYSGHGNSPFNLAETSPAQHLLEVVRAYDWIKQRNPKARVSVVGASYGGFLASRLIRYREVAQLVLRAPAIYRPEVFYDLWRGKLGNDVYNEDIQRYRTNAVELSSNSYFKDLDFQGRVFVVAHEEDEVIPAAVTDVYTNVFSADAYVAKGFKHALSQSGLTEGQFEEYQRVITNWLNKV